MDGAGYFPPPPREAFTPFSLGYYLDSPAGQALVLQFGGDRNAAAASLEQNAHEEQAWRRARAQEMYDRDPARYPGGMGEALARVGRPAGGGGAFLAGKSADLEALSRRNPGASGFRVLGPEPRDDTMNVGHGIDRYGAVVNDPELTRPPWQRGD